MFRPRKNWSFRQGALVISVLATTLTVLPAGPASAGLLELLFGGFQRREPPPAAQAYADPSAEPGASERRSGERLSGGERGSSGAYCVRLCDGQHFRLQNTSLSAAQACNSFCPTSKTKVFSGSTIDHAVSSDGKRYSDLPTAFAYRAGYKADCTCNGKTPGGLATPDINTDPTLRPGDIVATNDGFVAYKGGNKKGTAEFSPLSAEARRKLADVKVTPAAEQPTLQVSASSSDVSASGREDPRRAQLSR